MYMTALQHFFTGVGLSPLAFLFTPMICVLTVGIENVSGSFEETAGSYRLSRDVLWG